MARLLLAVTIILSAVILVQSRPQNSPKFPSFCRLFNKLGCSSEEKRKHICCRFLQTLGDNGLTTSKPQESPNSSQKSVAIRPLRLPNRSESSSESGGDDAPSASGSQQNAGRYDVFNRPDSTKPRVKPSPKSQSRPDPTPQPTANSNKAPVPSATNKKRPKICLRLVVNCRSNPEHSCCRYEDEKKDEGVAPSDPQEHVTSTDPPTVKKVRETEAPKQIAETQRDEPPSVVKGTVEAVPLKTPQQLEQIEKYESIINEEIPQPAVNEEPYERIPAECFTMSFDCADSPTHMCCAYQ